MTPICKESCCDCMGGSSGASFNENGCGDEVEAFDEVDGFETGELEDLLVVMTFLRPPKSSRMSSSSGL